MDIAKNQHSENSKIWLQACLLLCVHHHEYLWLEMESLPVGEISILTSFPSTFQVDSVKLLEFLN